MAGRNFGRMYRFSSANRPLAPATNTSGQDSAQYDRRQYPSATRDTSLEPRSSPPRISLRKDDPPLPASPTYSIKKATSPPSSPPYRGMAAREISSPPKMVDEYPKYKPITQPRLLNKFNKPSRVLPCFVMLGPLATIVITIITALQENIMWLLHGSDSLNS